tara:strand:+ start:540 stop:1013 length:474 start_codon:yes stop_codon:yes gene_type:complete
MKKILFLHGLESKPGGAKPTFLERNGYEVVQPPLDKSEFEGSVNIAQRYYDETKPDIVVGSSRGGAIAMAIKSTVKKVLIAPAWRKYGVLHNSVDENDVVLHAKEDTVVPYADSVELLHHTSVLLHEVGTDHRMCDEETLSTLLDFIKGDGTPMIII